MQDSIATLSATQFLRGMLFQISATDPITFVGVTFSLLLVTLVACLIPTLRALRVDPVEVLLRR